MYTYKFISIFICIIYIKVCDYVFVCICIPVFYTIKLQKHRKVVMSEF